MPTSSILLLMLKKILFSFLALNSLNGFAQITKSLDGQSDPLWEAGAGLVTALTPAYPASEDTKQLTIPFPTFFYRGEILRADEEGGARGRFFKTENFEINLSIGGSLPANSKDVKAREGMPDLDTMIELGPGLLVTLWKKKGVQNFKLGLNIPLRTAFAVEFFKAKEQGLVFNPLLYFVTENILGPRVFTFTGISSIIASQKFHQYFYQVEPQFATIERPSYDAQSGYLGTTLAQGFSKQIFNQVNLFLGLSYSNHKGAANKSSPLFKEEHNFSAAIGFVWWFYESRERAREF